jgi:hypothetical protein
MGQPAIGQCDPQFRFRELTQRNTAPAASCPPPAFKQVGAVPVNR